MIVHPSIGARNLQSIFAQTRDWERELAQSYWPTLYSKIEAISRPYAIPTELAAGAFCALSPNNTESNNLEDLANICHAREAATVRTYGACKDRALSILFEGHWPDAVLGRKTRSMWHNICYPNDDYWVTVDGHMFGVWNGKRTTMDESGMSDKEYDTIALGLRLASLRARRSGFDFSPCQYQAVLWMAWKRIHKVVYNPQMRLFPL